MTLEPSSGLISVTAHLAVMAACMSWVMRGIISPQIQDLIFLHRTQKLKADTYAPGEYASDPLVETMIGDHLAVT